MSVHLALELFNAPQQGLERARDRVVAGGFVTRGLGIAVRVNAGPILTP